MKLIYLSIASLNAAVVILALAHFNQGKRIKALEERTVSLEQRLRDAVNADNSRWITNGTNGDWRVWHGEWPIPKK